MLHAHPRQRPTFAGTAVRQLMSFALFVALSLPAGAWAFCGFYVSSGDAKLVNNATRVALMRHGDRTVLSLQPDYEGPAEEFAMVVPVPEILKKDRVKTLNRSLFDTLDNFTSPRMSEYWEQDPCPKPRTKLEKPPPPPRLVPKSANRRGSGTRTEEAYVKVRAKFAAGEYDIVILDSNDATALERWLVDHKYKIPKGAAPYLAPYINSGQYFFVAKVDPDRAKFDGNQAILSPLRFHYTSKQLSLPIRLGMINAEGEQDIVVFVLGEDRYVPANYPHAPIPTNIVVKNGVRERFGAFYEGLFSATRDKNEDAIVTEYVWELATMKPGGQIGRGRKCDPCTGPVTYFTPQWMLSLGLDVFGATAQKSVPRLVPFKNGPSKALPILQKPDEKPATNNAPKKLVVTRLHGRFKQGKANADIIFQKADPLTGGMGTPDRHGSLQPTKFHPSLNMFQGRYVILHHWKGKTTCDKPQRGIWGGPPNGQRPPAKPAGGPNFGGKKQKKVSPRKYTRSKIDYSPPTKKE